MKKLLVFFIGAICACSVCINFSFAKESTLAIYGERSFVLDLDSDNCSILRNEINSLDRAEQIEIIEKILTMGFSLEQALQYVYPKLQICINEISEKVELDPDEPSVFAIPNSCKINFKNAKNGTKIDKNALFNDFFEALKNNGYVEIKTVEEEPQMSLLQLEKCFVLVASFETDFSSSSAERKNNIKLAMQSIDGMFIKSGETFSFNAATGARSEENGYQSAKIIKNGEYVEGFGGGVCQVSTTLYNACVLSGLTIAEVHNHSLPIGYVLPGFDAMVNMGTSDLKITNETKNDYLITTCSNQDKCRVCIYGVLPRFKIKRRFDKYQELPAEQDIVQIDESKHDGEFTEELHYITAPKDGYRVKSYLDYYDGDVLIKSEQVRDCTYLPRRGVVLKVESVVAKDED